MCPTKLLPEVVRIANYWTTQDLRRKSEPADEVSARLTLRALARSAVGTFDVFLSHSIADARVVLGVRQLLVAQGLTVYVDWVDDPQLERSEVSAATAARLRQRMRSCRSLLYATSRAARRSRWMPWELGYFDGCKGSARVSIMPIENQGDNGFVGEEYLELYKLVTKPDGLLNPSNAYVVPPSGRAESIFSFGKGLETYNLYVQR